MEQAAETFRDRKKLRTRQQLMEAAIELFSERGFDDVTVEEIAERAWVSERTFFRYFPTKEDVLWPDGAEQLGLFADAIVSRPEEESPLQAVRNAMLQLAATLDVDSGFQLARAQIVAATPSLIARDLLEYSRWETTVRDAVGQRVAAGEDDLAPAMTAVVAGGALRVAFDQWASEGAKDDLVQLIPRAFEAVEAALRD